MKEFIKALSRIVKIYQIPNVDNEALVYLSEWIMDEYTHYDLGLIHEALKYPPRNSDNTWRMTPDTIRFWVDKTREKVFDRRLKEESIKRQSEENKSHEFSPETEKMIKDFKNTLLDGLQRVPEMTEREIKDNGQDRPQAMKYPSTDQGYVKEWTDRVRKHAELTYRERHPQATDIEVKLFLDNL